MGCMRWNTRSTNYENRGWIQATDSEIPSGNVSSLRLEANTESSKNFQCDLVLIRVRVQQ